MSVIIGATNSSGNQVQLNGNYVFAPDNQSRFASFQANTSTNLSLLSFDPDIFSVTGIAVVGNYAYVTSTNRQLVVFDVSSPSVIAYVREKTMAVNPIGASASGNFLFVANGTSGIEVFDIGEAGNPASLGIFSTTDGGFGAQFTNNFAFVAAAAGGLRVYALTNDSPDFLTNKVTTTPARHIRIGGNNAYIACDGGRLEIINIQNPLAPTLSGTFQASGNFSDLDLAGNLVVLANTNGSVLTVNVSNPTLPTLQGSNYVAGGAMGLRVAGERAIVRNGAGNLAMIQLAAVPPMSPIIVSSFLPSTELVGTSTTLGVTALGSIPMQFQWRKNGVALTNDARFQGVNTPSLHIVNLTLTDSGNYSISVTNTFGSVTSSNSLLVVPAGTPVLRNTTDVGGEALGLDISGNLAYVASGNNGIEIFNITSPRHPIRVDGVLAPPFVFSVRAFGDYVFAAVGAGGF